MKDTPNQVRHPTKDDHYTQEYIRAGKPNEGCSVASIAEAVRLLKAGDDVGDV